MIAIDLHLIPGLFEDGAAALLPRLANGAAVRVEGLWPLPPDEEPSVEDLLGRLLASQNPVTEASFRGRMPAGGSIRIGITVVAAHPPGRRLLGLTLAARRDDALRDLEQAALGLACAALAHAAQGAMLLGRDLGGVGIGLPRGTVAEQVRGALEVLGDRVDVIVATADTLAALGDLAGFRRFPLANLWELRRE